MMDLRLIFICFFVLLHTAIAGYGNDYGHHDDHDRGHDHDHDHDDGDSDYKFQKFENTTLHLLYNVERFAIRTEVAVQTLVEKSAHALKHIDVDATAEDCSQIQHKGYKSGVYFVQPLGASRSYQVYCDFSSHDGNGWTVIQSRVDGALDFYRNFNEYVKGFGDRHHEFWTGLEALHELTSRKSYELFVELEDFDGQKRVANYRHFLVTSQKDGYRLSVGNYSGDAGDSLSEHNLMKFSTYDVDHDESEKNCAKAYKGSWWFKDCLTSHLNGRYSNGENSHSGKGIVWKDWKGEDYSLKSSRMSIREVVDIIEVNVKSSAEETLEALGERFDEINNAIAQINLDGLDSQFDALNNSFIRSFQGIDSKFDTLTARMIQQFEVYDGRFDTLTAGYAPLEKLSLYGERFDAIDASLLQAQHNFVAFDKRFDVIEGKMDTIELQSLNDRITKVESTQAETLEQLKTLYDLTTANSALLKDLFHKLDTLHLQTKEVAQIEEKHPEDCEYVEGGLSGIYTIQPPGTDKPFKVYCDFHFQENRWTVIQNRFNGKVDFFRGYADYRNGFGDFLGEFWLGLEKIYQITKNGDYDVYIEMCDFEDTTKCAKYEKFSVCSEADGYRLNIDKYSGDAGDSLSEHRGHQFSTYDHDVDANEANCAEKHHGAWWYTNCHNSNLNGRYSSGPVPHASGMVWKDWHGYDYPLKSSKILIRKRILTNPRINLRSSFRH